MEEEEEEDEDGTDKTNDHSQQASSVSGENCGGKNAMAMDNDNT